MKYPSIWADSNGMSHFKEVEPESTQMEYVPGLPMDITAPDAARSVHCVRLPPGTEQPWHTSPHPHYAITLSGEVEIVASDGERRRFRPGQFYVGRDTTGQGHETRVVGDQDWVAAVVTLAD